jgi:hypothetical protein
MVSACPPHRCVRSVLTGALLLEEGLVLLVELLLLLLRGLFRSVSRASLKDGRVGNGAHLEGLGLAAVSALTAHVDFSLGVLGRRFLEERIDPL